ncbi:DUF7507 domain-containing protein, partial [Belliella aquatica]
VENDGDFTLTNVGVSDALPGLSAITQTSGTTTLAPGRSAEFTATYTITQADVDNGSVVNTAIATGTPPTGTDVTATDTETITVDISAATASISIAKSASQSTYGLGDVITYTFTVENDGDFTLTNVGVSDALPGLSAITQSSGTTTLAPGGSAEFTATYTITQTDVDNGSVVNTAIATGTPPTGTDVTATDTETITVDNSVATASIRVRVEAIDFTFAAIGDQVAISYSVRNTGNFTLYNVLVKDPATGFEINIEKLEPGEEVLFPTIIYTITVEDFNVGYVDLEVEAVGYTLNELEVSDQDYDEILKQIIQTIDVAVIADIPVISQVGQVITYTYEVSNIGNSDIGRVSVKDPITGLDILLEELLYQDTYVIQIVYVVTQEDLDRGYIENVVTAEIIQFFLSGIDGTTAEDDELVLVTQDPSISITKESEHQYFVEEGEVITYTLTVRNNGNVTLRNIHVEDPLTGLVIVIDVLAPLASQQLTTTYTVQQQDMDRGEIINNASVTGDFNGTIYTATDSLVIPLRKNDIEANMDNFQENEINGLLGGVAGNVLDNDKLNGNPVKGSEVIITVKDEGGMPGVSIDKDGNLIVPKGTAPGTYVITYTICDVLDPENCDEAIAIVEVFHGVNLKITKTVETSEVYEGDEFIYILRVENNGNIESADAVVTDILPDGLRYVSATVNGPSAVFAQNGQELSWKFAMLLPGDVAEIALRVKAAPLTDGRDKSLVNTATVSSPQRELSPDDNSSSAAVNIKAFFIPNTITPNGDRINDTFEIPGLGRYVSNELLIFNRWGDHVYERKNYQNDWSAEGLVSGTYFYLLKVTDESGKDQEFKGFIQVVKERIR